MWPGEGSILGGKASTEADNYATQPGSIPTMTSASGIWTPDDAAFYIRNNAYGKEWPIAPDPNFASVAVLIHMNRFGQNGNLRMLPPSRAPNDCDAIEKVTQGVSGIVQQTRQFGLYSWLSGGGTEYILHNVTNSITLGTGDLTAEGWVFITSSFTAGGIWDFRTSTSDTVRPTLHMATTNKLALFVNGDILVASSAFPSNQWSHFAWCRASGTSFLYVNGVSVGSVADANNYPAATSIHVASNVNASQDGCDKAAEFRLTVGVARYPGGTTFTVPTPPFPDY